MKIIVELEVSDHNHNSLLLEDVSDAIRRMVYLAGRQEYYDRSLNTIISFNIEVNDVYKF